MFDAITEKTKFVAGRYLRNSEGRLEFIILRNPANEFCITNNKGVDKMFSTVKHQAHVWQVADDCKILTLHKEGKVEWFGGTAITTLTPEQSKLIQDSQI